MFISILNYNNTNRSGTSFPSVDGKEIFEVVGFHFELLSTTNKWCHGNIYKNIYVVFVNCDYENKFTQQAPSDQFIIKLYVLEN